MSESVIGGTQMLPYYKYFMSPKLNQKLHRTYICCKTNLLLLQFLKPNYHITLFLEF